MISFLWITILSFAFFGCDVSPTPIGQTVPKSNLFRLENGVLEGGYNIAGNSNDASSIGKDGGFALNTNYAEAINFKKNSKTGASNTQTAGTTGVNAAITLPAADQKLLDKYGNKLPKRTDSGNKQKGQQPSKQEKRQS